MTTTPHLQISLLPGNFAICKFPADGDFPEKDLRGVFFSLTKTAGELSVVCEESSAPSGVRAQRNRRLLRVEGPLDFSLTGILASLASPLAEAGISILSISTYDTDYLLVAGHDLDRAMQTLERSGHTIHRRAQE